MKKDSYEIGDWVYDKSGHIVKITHHDMPELPYEEIERDALPEEIPYFEVDGIEFDSLNKENFFDKCMKHCPKAFKLFCDWIDDYKKSEWKVLGVRMNWDILFSNGIPTHYNIKFHDLPFEMQFGILIDFFSDKLGFCSFGFSFSNWQERDTVVAEIIEWFVLLEVGERNNWAI